MTSNKVPDNSSQPPQQPVDYSQPVAYDVDGRPLYAHPPAPSPASHRMAPPGTHFVRHHEPTLEAKARHEQSKKDYPLHNLAEGEYIIRQIPRHPTGLLIPIGTCVLLNALILAILISYPILNEASASGLPSFGLLLLPAVLLMILISLGGYIAYWVFQNNQLYLTNEGVIQKIQHSLFSRREQKASLANIEDASFRQVGILPLIFNYGKLRLSTQGDETTYRLTYVANPRSEIARINNAISDYKNGRVVDGE